MAHSPNGRYVVIEADVWLDKKTDTIKVTSQDPDATGGMYLTVKKGTKSDANLRRVLDHFCGGKTAEEWAATALRQARTRADKHLEEGNVKAAVACLKRATMNAEKWLAGTHEKQDQAFVPPQAVLPG